MAWMFAATEQDMTVGMHLHYHYLPPYMPPTPFYPHPAIGFIQEKLCGSVKADNRKAAKTGSKTKILLPPHLPILGPLCTIMPKENTGIQQIWMGAGIGVHPFGGIGFVILEGKPAAGMLSNCMGCWSVAPGLDMMLPFIGLDFVMIPTRGVSVLYGPAPLALDLFVFLLAMLQNFFDWVLSKVPDGFWKNVLTDAFGAVMAGAETFCDAIEQGKSPGEALKAAAAATAYTFVNNCFTRAVNAVTAPFEKALGKNPWTKKAVDFALDAGFGTSVDKLKAAAADKLVKVVDPLTGGYLGQGRDVIDERNANRNTIATAPNPLGAITGPLTAVAGVANTAAGNQKAAFDESKKTSAAAKEKAAGAKKTLNDPNATPEQKAAAKQEYNAAKKDARDAEKKAAEAGQNLMPGKFIKDIAPDAGKAAAAPFVAEGLKQGLGVDGKSAGGKAIDHALGNVFVPNDPNAAFWDGNAPGVKALQNIFGGGAPAPAPAPAGGAGVDALEANRFDDRKQQAPLNPNQQGGQADKIGGDRGPADDARDMMMLA